MHVRRKSAYMAAYVRAHVHVSLCVCVHQAMSRMIAVAVRTITCTLVLIMLWRSCVGSVTIIRFVAVNHRY